MNFRADDRSPADLWRVPGSAFKADGRREALPFDSACGAANFGNLSM
jgi:RES domain-containing protein